MIIAGRSLCNENGFVRQVKDMVVRRGFTKGVYNDPFRLLYFIPAYRTFTGPGGEAWIVGLNCPYGGKYGVYTAPHLVYQTPGLFARYPLGLAFRCRNLPVKCHCNF